MAVRLAPGRGGASPWKAKPKATPTIGGGFKIPFPKVPGLGQSIINSTPNWGVGNPNIGGGLNASFWSNDYSNGIGGSPDLSEIESLFKAQSSEDAATRDAALRRLAVSYGALGDVDTSMLGGQARNFWNSAMDQQTRDLAAKAEKEGLSVHSRQAHADEIARRQIPAQLAARGLLRSGQTGYDLGEQARNYKIQQYDTLNELLGNVEGTVGNFLQSERDRQMQLAQARMAAAWDAAQNSGYQDLGGPDFSQITPLPRVSVGGSKPPLRAPYSYNPMRRNAPPIPISRGRRRAGGI